MLYLSSTWPVVAWVVSFEIVAVNFLWNVSVTCVTSAPYTAMGMTFVSRILILVPKGVGRFLYFLIMAVAFANLSLRILASGLFLVVI